MCQLENLIDASRMSSRASNASQSELSDQFSDACVKFETVSTNSGSVYGDIPPFECVGERLHSRRVLPSSNNSSGIDWLHDKDDASDDELDDVLKLTDDDFNLQIEARDVDTSLTWSKMSDEEVGAFIISIE